MATVGYTPFFVSLALLDLLGAVLLWCLVREPGQPQAPMMEQT
jgi:MFS transporter, ACS family, hexuronate transporter